ncbi:MAG: hypothetical protein KKD77_21625, partial [Gammaproteobacteria bacterium]|nr:hypothetical protein [Gammaproteobacteria bacterium]
RMENYALTFGKMWDEPQQGEDHATHLKMHKAYRLEFTGLEQNYPPEFTGMLDQHIKMTEFLQQQEGAAMQSPAVPMNETPGEVAGNALAAPMGAMNMGVTNAGP